MINPISSSIPQLYTPVTKEASEATVGGKDLKHDGDSDDGAGAVAKPTVNTSGQTTGQLINTTA